MKVYKISTITLSVKNMEKSCKFYSGIPGFKIVYGGSNDDTFTTFKIGEDITMYFNLELRTNTNVTTTHVERTNQVRNNSLRKQFPMALYGIIAAFVVIMVAIPNEGLLPVVLLSAMAIACGGQVALDIRRHPHHRLFKL
jgi:catechol 2,3-dioxygenase-like lactoylglutathione lyase family enzyme